MSVLAIDLGATSGRVSLATFDGATLTTTEVHRFANDPVQVGGRLHWDILRLLHEIKEGFRAAAAHATEPIRSFGIDSWGLDYGLLDAHDELIGNPIHYRDPGADGAMERVCRLIPKEEIFARTGIQFMPINTLFQLAARIGSPALERARTLLQIPDLIRFFLTSEVSSEYTNATTTQCLALATGDWDRPLVDRLGIPASIFQPVVRGPALAGRLTCRVQEELGLSRIESAIVAEHDTASAVVAVPARSDFAYVSCGTWALLGAEVLHPVVDERALAWNFTNEGGLEGTYRLLTNIMGLWLVDSCRRTWAAEGHALPLAGMEGAALSSPPFVSLVDPDAPAFLHPPSMPDAIRDWCRETGQVVPTTPGAILRCIHESLALKFRLVLDRLESLTGHRYPGLHLVGGGAHNGLLCQSVANAIDRPVWSGPVEATTIGNAAAQFMAAGQIGTLGEVREIVGASFQIATHLPRDRDAWETAYATFASLIEHRSTLDQKAPR